MALPQRIALPKPESSTVSLVLFEVSGHSFALRLQAVDRVLPMVEIARLPKAPRMVTGVINLQGEILPVFDLRRRLRLAAVAPRVSDHLLIARASRGRLALVIERVLGIEWIAEDRVTPADDILPSIERLEGVAATTRGALLIQDVDQFLSPGEGRRMELALADLHRAGNA
jgi:purine-binding chemotaxis protein CheW